MRRPLALLAAVAAVVLGAPLTVAHADTGLDARSVSITVTDISRSTPLPTAAPRPLTFSLELHNNTDQPLPGLTITAVRGDPIATQAVLDKAIADPQPPSTDLESPVHGDPLKVNLAAAAVQTAVYRTTTSTDSSIGPGICLCGDFIYPIVFTAEYTGDDGASTVVGTGRTLIPAFGKTSSPAPVQVSWIWPLLDRPHRVGNTRNFVDDDLTTEVAAGGRLDRALEVVEAVSDSVPMTLFVDPDLLDELEVMASGNYNVLTPTAPGGLVTGKGGIVARAWLDRFRALLTGHPAVEVELTPYADPDIETLTTATTSPLPWSSTLSDAGSQARLADALADRSPLSQITWPFGGTLSQPTLTNLVERGSPTVVLGDKTLTLPNGAGGDTNALARIRTSAGEATAAVTSTDLQNDIRNILQSGSADLARLPDLVARVAMRVIDTIDADTSPTGVSHYVLLAPPRQLDVIPDVAERVIMATAHQFWSTPLTVETAVTSVQRSNFGVVHVQKGIPSLPNSTVSSIQGVDSTLVGLTGSGGLFDTSTQNSAQPGAASKTVNTIAKIPAGLQRAASVDLLADPRTGSRWVARLAHIVNQVRGAVHLVQPAGNGSYTLTSTDAPLPVTVVNPLDTDVSVRISVLSVGNRPGLSSNPVTVRIPANTTQQQRIPTSITITGRINVLVTLSTQGHMTIGDPLRLSVRNTALGTVGVAITTTAAIVLAIALLFRFYRALRWRWRQRNSGPPPPETDPLAA